MSGVDVSIGDEKTISSRPGAGGATGPIGNIDQYDIREELGGGGFGTVYRAVDTTSGIDVAVKGLPPVIRNNREELENVRRNFALVSRLHHPNIAAALVLHPVRDVNVADAAARDRLHVGPGDTLMVMEYARGVTLSQWRKQYPDWKVPLDVTLDVCGQIAAALDYAHERGIAHRDIKPANVMVETGLDGRRTVRVLDFGLAAEIRSTVSRVSMEVRDTSGTRPYMAPEQWLGQRQGPATDQYALAVVAYEMLSGEVPFSSVFDTGDPVVMMNVVGHETPDLGTDLPGKASAALLRALSKSPEDRFDSCCELIQAMGGARQEKSKPSKAKSVRRRQPDGGGKGRVALWLAAGLAAAAAAAGGFLWYRDYDRRQRELSAEVCLLEAKASQASEKNATAEWKDVACFGDRSRQLESFFRAGKQAMAHGELQVAKEYFTKVREDWYWLSSNCAARTEMLSAKSRADEIRSRGVRVAAATYAADGWRKADAVFAAAERGMREGAFDVAAADYRRTVEMLEGVVQTAEREQLATNTVASKAAFAEGRYADAFRLSLVADLEDPEVNFDVGWMYERGCGTEKDEKKALEYYRKAEAKGYVAAVRNIGLMYEEGMAGLEKNLETAASYYRRAADGNDLLSHQFLANMYEFGKGVPRDLEKARDLYAEAVESGQESSKAPLQRVKERIAQKAVVDKAVAAFRREDWAEGWRLAQQTDKTDRDVQFYIGVCHAFGHQVPVSQVEAEKWYRKAAEQGDSTAMYNLSVIYYYGEGGVPQDSQAAFRFAKSALENNEVKATGLLGMMYENGMGVEKDMSKAIEYYRQGVEQDVPLCCRNLGIKYEDGTDVEKDFGRAAELYKKASDKGDMTARAFLADMYENGKGVKKDRALAMRLYREAAAEKVDYAVKALERLGDEIDFDSPEALARQQAGLKMLGIDVESPFRYGAVVDVTPGTELSAMVEKAASGTTLRLRAGTYRLAADAVVASKSIRIVGSSPDEVSVVGPWKFRVDSGENSILALEGLGINTTSEFSVWDWGGQGKRGFVAIHNCKINGGSLWFSDGSRVSVSRCQLTGQSSSNDRLIHIGNDVRAYLSDCVSANAKDHALYAEKRNRIVVTHCRLSNQNKSTAAYVNGEGTALYMEDARLSNGEYGLHTGNGGSYYLCRVKFSNCSRYGIDGYSNMPTVNLYGCTFDNTPTKCSSPGKMLESSSAFSVNAELLK